jgi:hypothetical protein
MAVEHISFLRLHARELEKKYRSGIPVRNYSGGDYWDSWLLITGSIR